MSNLDIHFVVLLLSNFDVCVLYILGRRTYCNCGNWRRQRSSQRVWGFVISACNGQKKHSSPQTFFSRKFFAISFSLFLFTQPKFFFTNPNYLVRVSRTELSLIKKREKKQFWRNEKKREGGKKSTILVSTVTHTHTHNSNNAKFWKTCGATCRSKKKKNEAKRTWILRTFKLWIQERLVSVIECERKKLFILWFLETGRWKNDFQMVTRSLWKLITTRF